MENFDKQKGWNFYTQAVAELVEAPWRLNDDGSLDYLAGQAQIAESALNAKAAELQAVEPLRLLRQERNRLLSESDWWASSDLVMSNDRQIYRQQLRDMPAFVTPTLDDSGQLSGVTCPEIPE